jgi:hypothetical protein
MHTVKKSFKFFQEPFDLLRIDRDKEGILSKHFLPKAFSLMSLLKSGSDRPYLPLG